MTSLNEVRTTFLDFFGERDHAVVPSSPLVPHNDPTLLFTNAGMVPFKNVFTGVETREYVRATSSQKCVRAGGKHNDLDNVGYTARHHTFFEMLGNFSFGDYFKEQAIAHAWDLVTKVFELPQERLLVTVFSEDDEAFDLWRKMAGLPESKIIRIPTSDNFWAMGDTGPCGPCSEIFYDHGDHIPGGPPGSPDEDGDRFIEIWNLVFMQYDQVTTDDRQNLPKPSIDTGMGLERIAAVLQGTHDNYETDLFQHLIRASSEIASVAADGEHAVSHRVIADHLRASSFLIADGVLPSNEGRGYVLRRIMRRGMRHAHILGAKEPHMWRLVPALISEMGAAYPDLTRAESLIKETLKFEEEKFRQMLGRGLTLLEDAVGGLGDGQALPGDVAFKLYDTYGFPLDLTQDALRARHITVDEEGFNAAMAEQRAKAREAWKGSGETATEDVWFDLRDEHGATEFLGYESDHGEGQIIGLVKDGKVVSNLSAGDKAQVLTNQTPFYAESGGQIGDIGLLYTADGAAFVVTDTQKKLGDLHVHIGTLQKGSLALGDVIEMSVDGHRRDLTRANHSATHLLHAALRNVLGDHVTQKGSSVGPERLRFDFAHPKALTSDDIEQVEAEVNAIVRQNASVSTRVMTPDDAIEAGAMALFGEKYGDEVRVLTMGDAVVASAAEAPYSVELCGGTHVNRLGDIALIKVVNESAVASGVRRIEALTGEAARLFLDDHLNQLNETAALLKVPPAQLGERVASLADERKKLEREVAELKKTIAMGRGASNEASHDSISDVNGVKVMARVLDGVSAKDLRGIIDDSKQSLVSGIVAFVAVNDGKAAVATGVTEDLTDKISAVDLVKAGSAVVGGKGGGGRPDMAQAGGPDGSKAQDAIDAMVSFVKEAVS